MTDFTVYCIQNVSSAPQALSRRKETGEFYCHIAVPIPEHLVIFTEGQWDDGKDFDVVLRYKDDEIQLGHISKSNSCLSWRKGSSVPDSMVCESEKGMAKLVLENSPGPPVLINMMADQPTDKGVQLTEDALISPSKPQKNKRRSSLGKDDKALNGPNTKKQRLQVAKVTRLRKTDSPETKESKTKVTKKELNQEKPVETIKISDENLKEKKGRKAVKEENTEVSAKEKRDTKGSVKEEVKDKKSKKEKTDTSDMDSKVKKTTRKDSKTDEVGTGNEIQKEKKSRKGSKTEAKEKSETKTTKKEVGNESPTVGDSDGPQPKKKGRKGKKDQEATETRDGDKCDKENVDSNIPKVTPEVQKQISALMDFKLGTSQNATTNKMDTTQGCGQKKMALCKDLTSRALARPTGRWGHSLCFIHKNLSVLIGGQGEKQQLNKDSVWTLDTDMRKGVYVNMKERVNSLLNRDTFAKCLLYFLKVYLRSGNSISLCNHCCGVHWLHNQLVNSADPDETAPAGAVFSESSLFTETRRWKNPTTQSEGQKPENRMGHTATYDPMVRCIYVFGGSKNTRWFHDVHVLDIDEWKWQLVKVNGKAPTRAYHSATLYRHELWIFGGVYPRPDPQPDGCSNDIHIFSPVMESWYNPIIKGEKPIPRSGHSATLLNDQLVVFGGWDAPISYSDLHVLDMSIVEWTQPKFTGALPSPRSWHASCALTGNRLLIHGGYNGDFALDDTHIFNLDNLTWSQIEVDSKPTARVGHRALCMPYRHDNEEEDEVIIFGGGDNDGEYFDDLMSIYVPFDPVLEAGT